VIHLPILWHLSFAFLDEVVLLLVLSTIRASRFSALVLKVRIHDIDFGLQGCLLTGSERRRITWRTFNLEDVALHA
jgi:hypothetical protein